MVRSYGQYCAVAKGLDVVGDRWTLLVVRELLDGPQRYNDLLSALAPIATDMLAGRLRDLEAHGLVRRRDLPKPASGRAYELTDLGRDLEDVVDAYARWGRRLLDTRGPEEVVRPQWVVRAVRAFAQPDRREVDVTVRLVMPEGVRTVHIGERSIESLDDAAPVDVTLTGDAETLMAAMNPIRAAQLRAEGRLTVDGDEAAFGQLSRVFGRVRAETSTPVPPDR